MKGKQKVLHAKKCLRWLKKIIRNRYQGKVSFNFKCNLPNSILCLSWFYTSLCYSLIFPLPTWKLPFTSTLCFQVGSHMSTNQANWPQASTKGFQCLQPFSRRRKQRRAVFISPAWANYCKRGLLQSTEHSLLLLSSLGTRGAHQFQLPPVGAFDALGTQWSFNSKTAALLREFWNDLRKIRKTGASPNGKCLVVLWVKNEISKQI